MYDKEENKNKTPLSVKCTVSYLTDSHSLPRPEAGAHAGEINLERQNAIRKIKEKLSGVSGGREVGLLNFLTSIPGVLGRKPPRYFQ